MLTLKTPIQLHTNQGLTGNAEAFSERIRGNYHLLGAHFTPKDLLFLLTAPPELPEELGGMTMLVSNQTQVDARSVTLDVVNHVINRILLDGTSRFTYQDQVYITNVLNRLGITNVEQFMAQVRQLRTENESTVHLTRMYRSELERIMQRQAAGESTPVLPLPAESQEESEASVPDPRMTMSLSILQRLGTSRMYETVHAFQRNWTMMGNHFHRNELRLAEQLRFSNSVFLAETKQQFFQQPQVQMLHHLNQYETGTILEVPRDEETVLSQAAVAALVSAVDNTVTEVINRPQLRKEQWLRLENALWQTAENTLSRYELYHNEYRLPQDMPVQDSTVIQNHYAQEFRDYLNVWKQLNPERAEQAAILHRETSRQEEPLREIRTQENTTVVREPAQETREVVLSQPARMIEPPPIPAQPPMELTPVEAEQLSPDTLVEEIQRIDQHNRTVLQAVRQEVIQRDTAPVMPTPDIRRTMQDALRALEEPEQVLREIYLAQGAAPTIHPVYTAQEEALLKQADPATRALYERALRYQKDPEGTLAQGLVRPGNLGALNADIQRAEAGSPSVLEHKETIRETERLWEQSETILEQFHQIPARYRKVEQHRPAPEAVRIVHKQAASDVTEELLEQLEQERTQRTVKTESTEEITRQNVHRTDMTQVERQIVTQTTEDITELVNRTLAKQMRTISDQVYRQMEKRLQAERNRRGRF